MSIKALSGANFTNSVKKLGNKNITIAKKAASNSASSEKYFNKAAGEQKGIAKIFNYISICKKGIKNWFNGVLNSTRSVQKNSTKTQASGPMVGLHQG